MSGVYFLAAGSSSKNRTKSLDRPLSYSGVISHLDQNAVQQMREVFVENEQVYAWGANGVGHLDRLAFGDYVVDVKNKVVVRVFRFTFFIHTRDTRLQDWIGWDAEKSRDVRRPYPLVYFLRTPQRTRNSEKSFFQGAFAQDANPQWLAGQRWFDDADVLAAMDRSGAKSVEALLGIDAIGLPTTPRIDPLISEIPKEPKPPNYERPSFLEPIISRLELLRVDENHMEREHEDIVAHLFEILGYRRGQEIKFQRGRVDILIVEESDTRPKIVVEVKRDWSISKSNADFVRQAHHYAGEVGARWVILTNGDRYFIYDRQKGLSYEEQFDCEFELTALTQEGRKCVSKLYKGQLT